MKDIIEARSIPEPNSGCWLWLNGFRHHGYGALWAGGKRYRAHRVSFETYKGPIPPGMHVCHRCDTPSCVNPDHLFLGTPLENSLDMVAKGRFRRAGSRKETMTAATVAAIRADSRSSRAAAPVYGISRAQISKIRAGTHWAIFSGATAP